MTGGIRFDGRADSIRRHARLDGSMDGSTDGDRCALVRSFVRSRAVAYMMYGFGDSKEPDPASVELVEDMLVDYLVNVGHRSMEVAERRGRMHTEDLLYVIRNDRKKFARVDELLEMNAKLKDARRNFDLHDPAAVLAQQRADEEAARRREAEARAEAEAEGEGEGEGEEE